MSSFAIQMLYARKDLDLHVIHPIRRPDTFFESAFARGFYVDDHPNPMDQIDPREDDPFHARWNDASVLEKILWYWSTVNLWIRDFMADKPDVKYYPLRIEDIDLTMVRDVFDFCGISGVPVEDIETTLSKGVNISPSQQRLKGEPNPHSLAMKEATYHDWPVEDLKLLLAFCDDLLLEFYPTDRLAISNKIVAEC